MWDLIVSVPDHCLLNRKADKTIKLSDEPHEEHPPGISTALIRCTVWCDWFPVSKRTDSWPDERQSVQLVNFWCTV